jgi:hypothetical protein
MNDQQFPNLGLSGALHKEPYIRDVEFVDGYVHKDFAAWFRLFDGIDCHRYFQDFDVYTSGDFTETHTGSGTIAAASQANGVITIATAATNGDNEVISLKNTGFYLAAGYPAYFECRVKLPDVTKQGFVFGVSAALTHYTSAIADDGAVFSFVGGVLYGENMVETVKTANPVLDKDGVAWAPTASTWYRFGIHWDGTGTLRYFVFKDEDWPQTLLGYVEAAHAADADEMLYLIIGTKAEESAAKTLHVDYIKAVQKRIIP